MLNWFRGDNEDPEIEKIKKILKKESIDFPFSEIHKIGETIFSNDDDISEIQTAINKEDIDYLQSLSNVDVEKDLIQIYYLKSADSNLLIGIIDPFELYDNPVLIEKKLNIDTSKLTVGI